MKDVLQGSLLVGNYYTAETDQFISECQRIIVQNINDYQFGVDVLAHKLNMSHSSLYKKIKAILGISVNKLIRSIRLKHASDMLRKGSCNVKDAAYCNGFNDLKYFREEFKKMYKVSPSNFKEMFESYRENKEKELCYHFVNTDKGPLKKNLNHGNGYFISNSAWEKTSMTHDWAINLVLV